MIYLVKASDDLVSGCRCAPAPVAAPRQKDCPWCGCGWLFSCLRCREPFAFARAEEVDLSWEELARLDGRGEPEEWIDFMKVHLKDLKPGALYVYLDGWVFQPERHIRFDGWHSRHDFPRAPQAVGREFLDRTLATRDYWESRRVLSE